MRRAQTQAQGLVEYSLIVAAMAVVAIGGILILGPAIPYLLNCLSALL